MVRLSCSWAGGAVLALLAAASPGEGRAQIAPEAKAGKAPSADARDIEGVWFTTNASHLNVDRSVVRDRERSGGPRRRVVWPIDRKEPPFTEQGRKLFEERWGAILSGDPLPDPPSMCLPHGTPRIMIAPYPVQVFQSTDAIAFTFEVNHNFRVIHMDEPLPEDPDPTFMGHSVGRWEGDTLVIETIGLNGVGWIDEVGTPTSPTTRVTERLRKIEGGKEMELLITVADPALYREPWTAREIWDWRPDIRLMEYVCGENNRNPTDENGRVTTILQGND